MRINPSGGRFRNPCSFLPVSPHDRDTWLLEMPSMPMAFTRSSVDRAGMPCTSSGIGLDPPWRLDASYRMTAAGGRPLCRTDGVRGLTSGRPARIEKIGKATPFAQLQDAQLLRHRARLCRSLSRQPLRCTTRPGAFPLHPARSAHRHPAPSAAQRQSQSSAAACPCQRSSQARHSGSPSFRSSRLSGSRLRSQPKPARDHR